MNWNRVDDSEWLRYTLHRGRHYFLCSSYQYNVVRREGASPASTCWGTGWPWPCRGSVWRLCWTDRSCSSRPCAVSYYTVLHYKVKDKYFRFDVFLKWTQKQVMSMPSSWWEARVRSMMKSAPTMILFLEVSSSLSTNLSQIK